MQRFKPLRKRNDLASCYYKRGNKRLEVLYIKKIAVAAIPTMIRAAKLEYVRSLLTRSRRSPKFAATLWSEVNELDDVSHINHLCVQIYHWRALMTSFVLRLSDDHRPAKSYLAPATSLCPDIFQFQPIRPSEVLSALRDLDIKKSAGPDGISALFLRQTAEIIAEPLTLIYNHSLNTGTVPLAWKRSNVTPVYKGGDTENPGNFRPISVVPVVAKVLEKMVAHQLGLFLESHHLLNDLQGAYRHGRSAEHILLYAVDTITQALDNGDSVCAAFLDLKKAFDSLDHCLLLQRLF